MTLVYRVSLPMAWLRMATLVLFCFCSLLVSAAESTLPDAGDNPPDATTTTTPAVQTEQPKQCYNGCQRWGQLCNVDPRGVYKCQRRCEKFGEICE